MTPMLVLIGSWIVPLVVCTALQSIVLGNPPRDRRSRDRDLHRFRMVTFVAGGSMVLAAAAAGALVADSSMRPHWRVFGAWFLSSLCMTSAWVAVSLSRRTLEDAEAMSRWETLGRSVQTALVAVTGTGIATAIITGVQPMLPIPTAAAALIGALCSCAAVSVFSPWLMMVLGIWPIFRARIEVGGVVWRLAHLPAPNPFLTHVAAMPWLRTVLLTDGVLKRMPERYWRTLVEFEVTENTSSRLERLQRWLVALPLSVLVFVGAQVAAAGDPRKLVAGVSLAVAFTFTATWVANRQGSRRVSMDRVGPSPRDLAQTLRHLPPTHGQALPSTSHKPLGAALYDRLFALGHDPGPRRPR